MGVALLDLDARYTWVNRFVADRISGLPASAHVGRRPDELLSLPSGVVDSWVEAMCHGLPPTMPIHAVAGRRYRAVGVLLRDTDRRVYGMGVTLRATTPALETLEELERGRAGERALSQIATAVAAAAPPGEVSAMVTAHVGRLFDGCGVIVVRLAEQTGTVVARWVAANTTGAMPPGTPLPLDRESDGPIRLVARTGRALRHDTWHEIGPRDDTSELAAARRRYQSFITAPIHVEHSLWGAVCVASSHKAHFPVLSEDRLAEFADLVGVAVASTDRRARLEREAVTDPLTGLANHRAFQDRLRAAWAHADRHGGTLAVALIDVDFFKDINDTLGHQAGDRVLRMLGDRIVPTIRQDELLARVGGDEFAMLLPDADLDEAKRAAERIRALVTRSPLAERSVTLSIGVAALDQADSVDELVRLADGALYWAKLHGRDSVVAYDPVAVQDLSAAERAERLLQGQALAGLRGLARAVDAKDPATDAHSERVAELALLLAEASAWELPRRRLLHEAALVHDVGKIGLPDAILLKPGPLTAAEYEQVKQHSELGARIASQVLSTEQVGWVHGHHERWDGTGYPDGVAGDALADGAALLALADAWDDMTGARVYSKPHSRTDALQECRNQAGSQFAPFAVQALERIIAAHLL